MAIKNRDEDWCFNSPFVADSHYRRAQFGKTELRDFGRDVGIVVTNRWGTMALALTRVEAQKLFDDLWRYQFRPKEESVKRDAV